MTKQKSEKERPEKLSFKEKTIHFLKETGTILLIFLVLNSFVIASFEVPTGSMEKEILPGDFLLVNKFVFGGTTPRTIPFTDVKIPYFKLPALWKVERGDVIVFAFPGMRDEVEAEPFAYYLKRAIAIAGDTLQIINRIVYVNGKVSEPPRNINFNSGLIKPPNYADPRIFPKGAPYNEDNYGPIRIPKKGDVIKLNPDNFEQWEIFIKREGHDIILKDGKIFVDGVERNEYTVERDYVFGMGDNRDNSLDSRFWGFIPEKDVVGTPLILYWSWNPDIPLWDIGNKLASIRFNRIGKIVK
ncbi:MAG: Signal peptidase I [Ignavibacteriae bacterium]|nr:MAG: Signal peptidase I [Ignavibacteriota bacterium]